MELTLLGHRRVTSLRSERLGDQPLIAKGKIMGDEFITVYPPEKYISRNV